VSKIDSPEHVEMRSLAQEVVECLGATLINAETGLRWLDRKPLELEKVKQALDRVVKDSNRAGELVEGIRALVSA
jgi:hypothetical protein